MLSNDENVKKKYRCVPMKICSPDKYSYLTNTILPVHLPENVDLRFKMPPIFDQGELGSCTANAICALVGYLDHGFIGSRLFLYYNERKIENDINTDSGAYASDGINSLLTYGICSEQKWPYDITKFAVEPPLYCYQDALLHKALQVKNIRNSLSMIKSTLYSNIPFVCGISIYESFESDEVTETGIVPMPSLDENLLGYHEICICGYDDKKRVWIGRNSWGGNWGDNGYFYLPYPYLLNSNLTYDLWCIIKFQ